MKLKQQLLCASAITLLGMSATTYAGMMGTNDKSMANDQQCPKKVLIINNPSDQEFTFVKFEKVNGTTNQGATATTPTAATNPTQMGMNDEQTAVNVIFDLGDDYKNCMLMLSKDMQSPVNATCDNNKQLMGIQVTMEMKTDPMKYKLVTVTLPKMSTSMDMGTTGNMNDTDDSGMSDSQ